MTRVAVIVMVVKSLEDALKVYEAGLGFYRIGQPEDVPSMGARHVFLRAENCVIELLEPLDGNRPPGMFLEARGEGVFALGVRCETPETAREALARGGVTVVGSPARGDLPERWYVRPGEANGVLLELASLGAPDPI